LSPTAWRLNIAPTGGQTGSVLVTTKDADCSALHHHSNSSCGSWLLDAD
jgi:hypothetical protein